MIEIYNLVQFTEGQTAATTATAFIEGRHRVIGGWQDVFSCEEKDDQIWRKFCDTVDIGRVVVPYVSGSAGSVRQTSRTSNCILSKNMRMASRLYVCVDEPSDARTSYNFSYNRRAYIYVVDVGREVIAAVAAVPR